MKQRVLVIGLTLAALGSLAPVLAMAADKPVPCEKMLEQLRTEEKTAGPSSADKAQYDVTKQKGIDRCKADDDAGADALFAEALALLKK